MAVGFGDYGYLSRLIDGLKRHDRDEVKGLMVEGKELYSSAKYKDLLDSALEQTNEWIWFADTFLPPEAGRELRDMALGTMAQVLSSEGFELGKDFSFKDGGLMVSEEVNERLMEVVPEAYHDELRAEMVKHELPNPVTAIHEMLGVPFFDRLRERIEKRARTLPDDVLNAYLLNIGSGVAGRFPQLEDLDLKLMAWGLQGRSPEEFAEMDVSDKAFEEAGPIWLLDVIEAAGAEEGKHYKEGGISLEGMKLFAKVFTTPDDGRPELNEVVAAMQTVQEERKSA